MRKLYFTFIILSMVTVAFAQNYSEKSRAVHENITVYPTIAFRTYSTLFFTDFSDHYSFYYNEAKFEYNYDDKGHITQEKLYVMPASMGLLVSMRLGIEPGYISGDAVTCYCNGNKYGTIYELVRTTNTSYHQFSNKEFTPASKQRESNYEISCDYFSRYSSEDVNFYKSDVSNKSQQTMQYDNKGMLLSDEEIFWENTGNKIELISVLRKEAVLQQGIRKGISEYQYDINGESQEPDARYTFDSKGRVIRFQDNNPNYPNYYALVWSDDDKILEYTAGDNEEIIEYKNIRSVYNEKYIDTYGLDPFDDRAGMDLNDFQKEWFFDADVTLTDVSSGEKMNYTQQSTVNADGTRAEISILMNGRLLEKGIFTITDRFGSYTVGYEEYNSKGNVIYSESKTALLYDEYGAMVEDASKAVTFSRTYKEENHPIYGKVIVPSGAIRYVNGIEHYSETYTAWTFIANTGVTGIEQPASHHAVSVYPNPTTGKINIDTDAEITKVSVYNQTGQLIKQFDDASGIDISNQPSGIYFLKINTNEGVSNAKVIKK